MTSSATYLSNNYFFYELFSETYEGALVIKIFLIEDYATEGSSDLHESGR